MRTSILSATILAAMFTGGLALADVSTGAIKSIDEAGNTVTLANGTVYSFAENSQRHEMLGGYLPGDKVTIVWDKVGNLNEAQSMDPDFAAGVTGKIAEINEVEGFVTLDNGTSYHFKNDKGDKVSLGGFKKGDAVNIVAVSDGSTMIGRAISTQTSDQVTGKIKAIDQAEGTVTLDNGKVYVFNSDKADEAHLGSFKVGDMVKIEVTNVGNMHVGESITPANG